MRSFIFKAYAQQTRLACVQPCQLNTPYAPASDLLQCNRNTGTLGSAGSVHFVGRIRRRCPSSSSRQGDILAGRSPACPSRLMSHRQQNDGVSSSQVSRVDGVPSIDLVAPTERALGRLATLLVHKGGLQAGDVYCLHGDVGAGKSVFSRAFIRAAAGDPLLNVPSPTYLLQNLYDEASLQHSNVPIHHFDLYRLPSDSPPTLERLNLQASFNSAVSLVEWADRAQVCMPEHHLAVYIRAITPGAEQSYKLRPSFRSLGEKSPGDQGQGQHPAGATTSGEHATSNEQGSGIPVKGQAGSGERDELEEEGSEQGESSSDEDEDSDPYTDQRWRTVRLEAHGQVWQQRLGAVLHFLQEETVAGRAIGLRLC